MIEIITTYEKRVYRVRLTSYEAMGATQYSPESLEVYIIPKILEPYYKPIKMTTRTAINVFDRVIKGIRERDKLR